MIAYIEFFLISIYLSYHFNNVKEVVMAEKTFTESDYKKLFEYKMDDQHELVQRVVEVEETNKAVFQKKDAYTYKDLIEFYEKKRFTLPFMVYRAQRFWPLFDAIALYGHIASNFVIVYSCIYFAVSFYNCFNILCVCMFYLLSAQIINRRAKSNFDRSGLQSQCDVRMAQLITRRYKNETAYVFLSIRKKIWIVQITALLIVIILGNPATLLDRFRATAMRDPEANAALVEALDRASFWVFMAGLYKNKCLVYIFLALVFEKQCLNWLTNRNGCTHFIFQKCIELDIRRDSLRYNWLNPRYCKYDIENYRKHYFANDFDQVKELIINNISDNPDILKDEYGRDKQGDFIPGRLALRLKHTI